MPDPYINDALISWGILLTLVGGALWNLTESWLNSRRRAHSRSQDKK